ncbi:MAG: ABC transporter substrate-binding protein, partial [Thermoleophilia bacterium]|nr:ABC transporter substrate-binding protein [Thermoleophilia bacterium]
MEFTDHAACAMVAEEKGWFKDEGLNITSVENYVTGADLAAALARGDIQAAYICLVPAINARANGGVNIKVVAGTHKYGYALVGNPKKISTIKDLAKPNIKLACTQAGTACDVLLQRLCEKNNLPASQIATRAQRMNPPAQVLALESGKADACFVPEHWATLAEDLGFKILAVSQDIWPDMQGSVLVVKEELIQQHPDVVEKLVRVTQKATAWINQNPD